MNYWFYDYFVIAKGYVCFCSSVHQVYIKCITSVHQVSMTLFLYCVDIGSIL